MTRLRGHLSMSLDGYVAGPHPTMDEPLGAGGEHLHDWAFATRTWRAAHGQDGGEAGTVDDEIMGRSGDGVGATIMGRNMFGPVGEASDDWNGWWGDEPPFHHPVFVLTHHYRPHVELKGGTTFHFVTEGIETALARAIEAADGQDVGIGGGAQTVRQYLDAGLVDELRVTVVPILLGGGVRLFDGESGRGYRCVEQVPSAGVTHVTLRRA